MHGISYYLQVRRTSAVSPQTGKSAVRKNRRKGRHPLGYLSSDPLPHPAPSGNSLWSMLRISSLGLHDRSPPCKQSVHTNWLPLKT